MSTEAQKARARAYYWANAERIRPLALARVNARRLAGKVKPRVLTAEQKKLNCERVKAWAKANPEHVRAKKQSRARLVAARGTFTKEELRARFDEQCGLCAYCLDQLTDSYHVDHVIPVARGGTNTIDNIVCACAPCNHRKSAKTLLKFLAEVA